MDQTQEQMKFMGILSIFSQSFKTVFTLKKIFTQITLSLIVPLAIIFIAHMDISNRFFNKIEENPYQLITDACMSYGSYHNISNATSTDWLNYFLFKMITITIIIVFSLLSTATIVYTVVSVYTNRDTSFLKSMKSIPKVWKRLTVTFLFMFLTFFAYSLISSVVFFLNYAIFGGLGIATLILFIPYTFGFVYLSIIWQLACVVSVLESSYGLKSMIKAMDLMNGKKKVALTISLVLYMFLSGTVFMYMALNLYNLDDLARVWQMMIGIVCWVLVVITFLMIMVIQTMIYMVCKSYHGETIDPLSLSTYLGAYLSDSRPAFRVGDDIQLGRPHSQPVSQA